MPWNNIGKPATVGEVAEINDMLRTNLKTPTRVFTGHGVKTVYKYELSKKVEELQNTNSLLFDELFDKIRGPITSIGSEERAVYRDCGAVVVDNQRYLWWFEYFDTSTFIPMKNPASNGKRALHVVHESEM